MHGLSIQLTIHACRLSICFYYFISIVIRSRKLLSLLIIHHSFLLPGAAVLVLLIASTLLAVLHVAVKQSDTRQREYRSYPVPAALSALACERWLYAQTTVEEIRP